jgi:hypothetical protein
MITVKTSTQTLNGIKNAKSVNVTVRPSMPVNTFAATPVTVVCIYLFTAAPNPENTGNKIRSEIRRYSIKKDCLKISNLCNYI